MSPLPARASRAVAAGFLLAVASVARGHVECAILSIDGGGHQQIMDAARRGVMPHLAQLLKDAAVVKGLVPAGPDASTPPSHAALWTGAPSVVNGITGFSVHPGEGGPAACGSGFDARFLRAETIWSAAHRAGKSVFLLHAPMSTPQSVYRRAPAGAPLHILSGYTDLREHAGTVTGRLEAGKTSLRILEYSLEITQTGETLAVTSSAGSLTLATGKQARMTGPLTLGAGPRDPRVHLRVVKLDPGTGELVLFHSPPEGALTDDPVLHAGYVAATGGFGGQGPRESYKAGAFGRPIPEGGDGSAEALYVEIACFALDQVIAGIRFARTKDPALLVTYVTQPDEINHMWTGWLMLDSPYHDPNLAAALQPHHDRLLAKVDQVIKILVETVGPGGHVVLTSDHGRLPVVRHVYPNRLLATEGWTVLTRDGEPDLARSRVVYPCQSSHFLKLVRPEEAMPDFAADRALVTQVADHMLDFRDPATKTRVFTAILDVDLLGRRSWFGGDAAGDVLLLPAPGYHLEADATPGEILEDPKPLGTGMHATHGGIPSMHALCVMSGPRVRRGARLPPASHLHFAPTVAALMEIPAPAQAAAGPFVDLLAPVARK